MTIQQVQLSSFDKEWKPRDYLKDYYSHVMGDERVTISFLVQTLKTITKKRPFSVALFFGIGPTIHHILPVAPYAKVIHASDYLLSNLDEVRDWIQELPGAFNWRAFTAYTLECEGNIKPTKEQIERREQMVRKKLKLLKKVDARLKDPMGRSYREKYPIVISCYCADSATDKKSEFKILMHNIASLVAPGGYFITAALKNATSYRVGKRYFPSANINEKDLSDILTLDFLSKSIKVEVRTVQGHRLLGYEGILLAVARKSP